MKFDYMWVDSSKFLCPSALFAQIYSHIDEYDTYQLTKALNVVYMQLKETIGENDLMDFFGVFANYNDLKKKENINPAILIALEEHIASASIHVKSLVKELCWNWLYHADATDLIQLFRKNKLATFDLNAYQEIDIQKSFFDQIKSNITEIIHDPEAFFHWDLLSVEEKETVPLIQWVQENGKYPRFPYSPIMILPLPEVKTNCLDTLSDIKENLKLPFGLIKEKLVESLAKIRGKSFIEDYDLLAKNAEKLTYSNRKNQVDLFLSPEIKEHFEKIYFGQKGFLLSYTLHLAPIASIPDYFRATNTLDETHSCLLEEFLKKDELYDSWIPVLTSNLMEFEGLKHYMENTLSNN